MAHPTEPPIFTPLSRAIFNTQNTGHRAAIVLHLAQCSRRDGRVSSWSGWQWWGSRCALLVPGTTRGLSRSQQSRWETHAGHISMRVLVLRNLLRTSKRFHCCDEIFVCTARTESCIRHGSAGLPASIAFISGKKTTVSCFSQGGNLEEVICSVCQSFYPCGDSRDLSGPQVQ